MNKSVIIKIARWEPLLTLMQFLLIAYFAGIALLKILVSNETLNSPVIKDYKLFFQRWMLTSFILGFFYLVATIIATFYREGNSPRTTVFKHQIITTMRYIGIFSLAGVLSIWASIASASNQDINIGQAWQAYQPLILWWLICVIIFSGIRLIIVYLIISYRSRHNQSFREVK